MINQEDISFSLYCEFEVSVLLLLNVFGFILIKKQSLRLID